MNNAIRGNPGRVKFPRNLSTAWVKAEKNSTMGRIATLTIKRQALTVFHQKVLPPQKT